MRRFLHHSFRYAKIMVNDCSIKSALEYEDIEPVVLLIGWLGCRWKYLDHYVKMYDDLGISTVSTIPGFFSPFTLNKMVNNSSLFIENVMDLENIENRPIFPHVFSGLGTIFYHNMLHSLNSDVSYNSCKEMGFMKKNIKGEIFDSPTLSLNKETAMKGFVGAASSCFGNISYNNPFLETIFGSAYGLMMGIPRYRTAHGDETYQKNMESLPPVPKLVFYSKKDGIVELEDSLELIERQKGLGRDVEGCEFEDTLHCTHFVKHPDEYSRKVHSFIKKNMKN